MAYQPALPPGQGDENSSAPVVLASDQEALLSIMAQALQAIASSKGLLSDLRVTPTGTVTTSVSGTAAVTQSGTWNLSTVNKIGTNNTPMDNAVPNWQNQTAVQSFVQNIVRS